MGGAESVLLGSNVIPMGTMFAPTMAEVRYLWET